MKKYYIFAINREYYDVYKRNMKALYTTLKNLHDLDLDSLNYGLSIYNQLCIPIEKEVLKNYYQEYRSIDNHFYINDSIIEINKSCIVVLTKRLVLSTLKYLHYYDNPLFICNFDDNTYDFITYEYFKNTINS